MNPFAAWTLKPASPDGKRILYNPAAPAERLWLYPVDAGGIQRVGCTPEACRVRGWREDAGSETGKAWERRQPTAAAEIEAIREAFAAKGIK